MKGNIWQVAVIALFVSLVMAGPMVAFEGATHDNTQFDESVTVDYDQEVSVDNDAVRYNDTAVIRDDANNKLEDGTDYDWNATSGNITFQNTSATSEGDTVFADYQYETRDEHTQNIGSLFASLDVVIGLLLLMFGVGAAYTIAGGGGGGF
jgi:hypothetical protein